MPRREASFIRNDWSVLCAEASVGSLCALAALPARRILSEPALRRLLREVVAEAAAAARSGGHVVSRSVQRLAVEICRRSRGPHPWTVALRAGRTSGADRVLGPLLSRTGVPPPKLQTMAAVLRRLETRP